MAWERSGDRDPEETLGSVCKQHVSARAANAEAKGLLSHTDDRPEMLRFLEMSLTFWKKFRGVDKYL